MPVLETTLAGLLLWALIGYLLGSVPFGLVIARLLGLGDLRKIGSGNIGATNVLRTGNRPAALATLILDSFKGAIAVLIARWLAAEDAAQLAGLMAFLGHCFPIWLGFKGGKGVATFLGLLLGLAFPLGLAACATWAAGAALTRISSASALLAAALAPAWAWGLGYPSMVMLCLVLAAIVWGRHHANIRRILKGEEPRIGKKS
ncbi:MAG: glycerol-3-phosphate 1-O-acyltransferase PlsY [Marinovum algicola]|jgi:glycerol-3-phosphate acyltransferase PlsY|uniref:Glycerol-3-phosphate acyltransferase n=1 Tax=Marinovum algicola TaxID=42444 RepID=A0A975W6E0_9RHOB|nr:glycerol-3-phosphate 1-O-acyltransferase PlsY [Marinovum algicola]SEI51698.1 acyl-phosphate glycerol-3-phosphate acyltransferase [Marinovum algicola]SLN30174.1 putative glycerol-3-phosphate acyltransferase [Marinovum algicola]